MILLRIAPAPACRTVIITGQQIGKVGAHGGYGNREPSRDIASVDADPGR
jgi:hypothetical protein